MTLIEECIINSMRQSIIRLLIVLLPFIQGCNGSDYTEELGGGYYYIDEGEKTKEIRHQMEYNKHIHGKVISYKFNWDFIVVLQEPDFGEHKIMLASSLRNDLKKYPDNSESDRLATEKEADSILKNDPYYKSIFINKYNYWIIVKNDTNVIGPLTKQEYLKKRLELGVPENLHLEE
ncbi:MAG: hypothetical protein EOP52_03560 [Sphingobacteriales bacterium]|nr:MAG: hypothetical protein EOP52_03560 [Sphingobacteriales bacterium]